MGISNWIKSNNIFLPPVPDCQIHIKKLELQRTSRNLNSSKTMGNNAQILWAYHILLGVLATFFTIIFVSLIDVIDNIYIKVFSIIVAI